MTENTPMLQELVQEQLKAKRITIPELCNSIGYDDQRHLKQLVNGSQDDWPSLILSHVAVNLNIFEELSLQTQEKLRQEVGDCVYHARMVPVLDFALASEFDKISLDEISQHANKYYLAPTDGGNWLYFEIYGDSMNPILETGDLVRCDLDRNPENGDVIICKIDDMVYCKRLQIKGPMIELISDNPNVETLQVLKDEITWMIVAVHVEKPL